MIDHAPNIFVSEGKVHLVYQLNLVGDSLGIEIWHRYSDDWGLSWSGRYPLSTPEEDPNYRHSQAPSAFADSDGNIIAAWFDYKYGSECGFTGDILARISTDNGESWLPERRLTYTQTGSGSSCTIVDRVVYVAWMDENPVGCFEPKIMFSESSDWGDTWTRPIVISGPLEIDELSPVLISNRSSTGMILHCVMRRDIPGEGADLYYFRNREYTGISDGNSVPSPEKILLVAFPNPFNSSTTFTYSLSEATPVTLSIYNLLGQRVAALFEGLQQPGRHSLTWDASELPSGIYFARLRTGAMSTSIKIVLLK